jgi:phage terminase large subunit-like protein
MSQKKSLNVDSLPSSKAQQAILILEELSRRKRENLFSSFYPDEGPLRRELYPKHLQFFEAGNIHRERAFVAGNRTGKTLGIGAYELTCHLTGRYPEWWVGKRFVKPIEAWAAGDTGITTRDIIQRAILGPINDVGTGMIPKSCIVDTRRKAGSIQDLVDTVYVKHLTGGMSLLGLKIYDQRRESFQGTAKHVVWFDEEPPLDVYTEGLMRTMTVDGMVICTFTPLLGLSKVVLSFLPKGKGEF